LRPRGVATASFHACGDDQIDETSPDVGIVAGLPLEVLYLGDLSFDIVQYAVAQISDDRQHGTPAVGIEPDLDTQCAKTSGR
jgi:hypothetical protein